MRESAWYPAQHARGTKDGPKARADLQSMGIWEELHAKHPNDDDDDEVKDTESRRKGKKAKKIEYDYPPTCFTLSQEEIEQFFTCLVGVKFPGGYAGKISRYLDSAKQKFSGMKSHDSRADDADTSSCNPWDHGRARP